MFYKGSKFIISPIQVVWDQVQYCEYNYQYNSKYI
jgi:hypothetical protein